MFDFYIKVSGKQAIPIKGKLVGNNVAVDEVCFDFSPEWDGLIKTAVFFISEDEVYEELMENDKATIPHEVLVNYETVKVGAYATRDGQVYATTPVEIEVDEGIIVGANAEPGEYENIYIQVLGRLQELLDSMYYETSVVPEWTFDEPGEHGDYYITQISQKKIKVTAMNDAIVVQVSRPGKEPIYIQSADQPAVYSEEGFTVRYYTVNSSNTPPEIKIYDNLYKRKIAGVVQDHDITPLELLNECWQYLNSTYLSSGTKLADLNLKDNITASDLFYKLQTENNAKAHTGAGNFGLVRLASSSETADWINRASDDVGTIINIADAITRGFWSDSQMDGNSNNIVKNSVIKAYVDAVRNDKQNQIKQVVVNDGYWIDLEAYPGVKIFDLVTTTMGYDLWSCYATTQEKAYVNKIASSYGTAIAENAYTKAQVNALIGAIEKLTKRKVQELPETGEDNVIYLVPKTGETDDVYDEWMWIDNQWEHFGNTQIDLSGYVPTSRTLGRISLSNDVSAYNFAYAVITAIVEDSGSNIAALISRLDDFFQIRELGKGLSTNDYTTAEKTKLAGLNMENLPKLWFYNSSTPPTNPETLSGVKSGDICYCYVTTYEAFVGLYLCSAVTTDNIIWKPLAQAGKGLSTNDLTDELKNKLEGIDLTNYVTNTDYPSNSSSTGGCIKYDNGIYGIENVSGGVAGIVKPTDAEIEAQTTGWRVLTPAQLSKAVKEGVTNNSITLTKAEKKAARDWIGADGGEWEKLLDKTLQADNAIALDFSDVNFGGNYKKIRVQIRGQMSVNNSNILVYRMNSSSAYGIFGNIGKTAETLYDFEIKEKPFLIMNAIRDSTASVKSISASTNLVVNEGAIPFNQKMSETYEMKIVGNSTFLAGTRVVVYGLK